MTSMTDTRAFAFPSVRTASAAATATFAGINAAGINAAGIKPAGTTCGGAVHAATYVPTQSAFMSPARPWETARPRKTPRL